MELATSSSVSGESSSTPAPYVEETSRRSKRRNTSHLKDVPNTRDARESLKKICAEVATKLDKARPLGKDEMEQVCRRMLTDNRLPEGLLGWAMVVLATEFWRDQVAAVPPSRRLFLLPHCLKHAEGCPAEYDEFGLDCRKCGACSIADYRTMAEDLGYKVLVAEGSPIVLKIIVSGYIDAIVGVACLNVLEKAIDKILLAGIPCMAVPLLSSDCRNTSVDHEWVVDMIKAQQDQPPAETTSSYVHLMRASANMFEPDELERLAPRLRGKTRLSADGGRDLQGIDPLAATEAIAYDFLSRGGKHSRPFITLAVYDALTGGHGTGASGCERVAQFSDSTRRTAMAIETFHKASLVHDDIEDDDQYRYGGETIHRRFGIATGINVGDYLIGLGYRLVSRERKALGAEVAADVLDVLADCHMKLSEGQGAELLWRDAKNKRLTPLDALKVYALKTSPAFEAALLSGARLAGDLTELSDPLKQFARNMGVAFQILNDLGDWNGDDNNKLAAGLDALGGRPTLLLALALENLSPDKQQELLDLAGGNGGDARKRLSRVRELYDEAGVFEKANKLVDKHQQRAEGIADQLKSEELRRLMYYLIDTVLERPAAVAAPTPTVVPLALA